MASTKVLTTIQNLTIGLGTTSVSSGLDLQDGYGATCDIKITNGGTGPTVACQVQLEVSEDDSEYFDFGGPLLGSTGNNAVSSWGGVDIPLSTQYVRASSGSNTGQSVTLRIDVSETTAIS